MLLRIAALTKPRRGVVPRNDQIWPIIGIFGHFGPGVAGSFGWLVDGCGERAVSRKTPIYFI